MLPAVLAAALAGLASVPHCAGMCGPVVAFASARSEGRASVRYHLGRLLGYAVLGALAGASGGALSSALGLRWAGLVTSWTLAVALVLTAWRLWKRPAGGHRPVYLGTGPRPPSWSERALAIVPKEPLALGVATALLPCGALAGAVLIAAGAGSTLGGALAMAAFAVVSGTGLALVSALAAPIARTLRPGSGMARGLATALLVGAFVLLVRPLSTLQGEPPACHPDEVADASGASPTR